MLIGVGSSSATARTFGYDSLNDIQKRHVSGLLATELGVQPPARSAAATRPAVTVPQRPGPTGCPARRGNNVKVNQNCLNMTDPDLQGRGQAQNETVVAVDPNNPTTSFASYNDYRRGDGTCGVSYSLNGGRTGRTPHAQRVHPRRLRRRRPRILAGRR